MDINKLWQNFLDTVTNHYFDLNGRVGLARFWYFVLVEVVIAIAVGIVGSMILSGMISSLFGLAMLLPNLGMATRRMQDTGRNGVLALVAFAASALLNVISLIGVIGGTAGAVGIFLVFATIGWAVALVALVAGIAVIYFCIQPGQSESNAYGPPPAVWTPA
jgi:uncharacterized membrane protein YhaH (DUF805 family)